MAVARKVAVINDSAGVALPSFSFPGMPIGFIVCDTTGQNWQLTASTATVDHTTVEKVVGNPQLRWLTYTGGGGGSSVFTAITKNATGAPPTGAVALSTLGGPGLLYFAADGSPSVATPTLGYQGPTWAASVMAAAQADVSDLDSYWIGEVTNPTTVIIASALAGDNVNGTIVFTGAGADLHSALQASTTTVSSSSAARPYGSLAFVPTPSAGSHFCVSWLAKPITAPDAQTKYQLNLYDYATVAGFLLDGSVSTTTWRIRASRGGSAFVQAATGAGATLDITAYHRFTITCDGTTIRFYIDGVSAGTSNAVSALPVGDSWPETFVNNGTTAANRQMYTKEWFVAWKG